MSVFYIHGVQWDISAEGFGSHEQDKEVAVADAMHRMSKLPFKTALAAWAATLNTDAQHTLKDEDNHVMLLGMLDDIAYKSVKKATKGWAKQGEQYVTIWAHYRP